MARWNYLPTEVTTTLAQVLLSTLSEFRSFFTNASRIDYLPINLEYGFLLEKTRSCFNSGVLFWLRKLEQDFELGLSTQRTGEGMQLSKTDSLLFIQQKLELLTPSYTANLCGKTLTDLSFLRYEVAKRIHQTRDKNTRTFLWSLHKLISLCTRNLANSGALSYFPNTRGEKLTEETATAVATCLSSEFSAAMRFRAPLSAGPARDWLSAQLSDPIFEIFASNWNKLKHLTPKDVNLWLQSKYPAHRRSLLRGIANTVARAGHRSFRMRLDLSRRWELETPDEFRIAENVTDIFLHSLARTSALENFPY